MFSGKGKKIPSDIIKDQATRQAFDRVESRLRDIELLSKEAGSYVESAFTASGTLTSGNAAAISITSRGKPIRFWIRESINDISGGGSIVARTATLEAATTYQVQIQLRLYRVFSGAVVYVGTNEYGFIHRTATVGGDRIRYPMSGFQMVEMSPPVGLQTYYLDAVRFSTNGFLDIGSVPILCAYALR